ncbi:hypothetical protein GQ457_18G000450 [Hibiscus cannabinus]
MFSNGKALGGHMKGHLANHPLPPKQPITTSLQILNFHLQLILGQDREREIESRNPTRRRSKIKLKVGTANNATTDEIKKPKMSSSPSLIDSPPTEPKLVSSISDTFPYEEVEGEEMF